ncbi:MAG: hypothetical protein Q8O89_00460 [Nanoarchaeota archaeon]|nr:hypothetical protein [Nanoarchaeota archaeon]
MLVNDIVAYMLNKPVWFRLSDLMLGFFSILLAFLISRYAYRFYKQVNKTSLLYFSNAFFLLGISATMLFLFNSVMFLKNHTNLSGFLYSSLGQWIGMIFILIFILVTISAFLNLVFITLGQINNKTKFLIFLMVLVVVMSVFRGLIYFYILVLVLLAFILYHSIVNYINTRHFLSFGFLIAMLFMALSFVFNLFVPANTFYYAVAQLFSFLALAVILVEIRMLSKTDEKDF